MKLTAESTVINDGKLNTNIDNAQTSADNAQTSADNAQASADNAQATANQAQTTATQAKTVADNTAQYFWFTSSGSDTGAHISEKTQEQFVSNPSGGNLLARSNGIAVRDGLTELATFTGTDARIGDANGGNVFIDTDSIDIRDGSDVLATFGADGMRIGKTDEKHIEIKNNAFNVYDEDGSAPFSVYTGNSLQSVTRGRYSTVEASTTTYHQIRLVGTITDNKIYFGVSASGKPSSMTQYIENPSADEWKYLTISGVQFGVKIIYASVIQVMVKNNNTAKRYYGQQYNETYYETRVKVNDAMLDTQQSAMALIDTTGVSNATSSKVFTYGQIATIVLSVYNTASVISGGIIYRGTLLDFIPVADMKIVGVVSPHVFGGSILSDGTILVYNTTGSALATSASAPITLTATYIYK